MLTYPPNSVKVYAVRNIFNDLFPSYLICKKHDSQGRVFCLEKSMKTIICPLCGRVVGSVDDRRTVDVFTRCYKCHVGIKYEIKTKTTKTTDYPERKTSSGMTF